MTFIVCLAIPRPTMEMLFKSHTADMQHAWLCAQSMRPALALIGSGKTQGIAFTRALCRASSFEVGADENHVSCTKSIWNGTSSVSLVGLKPYLPTANNDPSPSPNYSKTLTALLAAGIVVLVMALASWYAVHKLRQWYRDTTDAIEMICTTPAKRQLEQGNSFPRLNIALMSPLIHYKIYSQPKDGFLTPMNTLISSSIKSHPRPSTPLTPPPLPPTHLLSLQEHPSRVPSPRLLLPPPPYTNPRSTSPPNPYLTPPLSISPSPPTIHTAIALPMSRFGPNSAPNSPRQLSTVDLPVQAHHGDPLTASKPTIAYPSSFVHSSPPHPPPERVLPPHPGHYELSIEWSPPHPFDDTITTIPYPPVKTRGVNAHDDNDDYSCASDWYVPVHLTHRSRTRRHRKLMGTGAVVGRASKTSRTQRISAEGLHGGGERRHYRCGQCESGLGIVVEKEEETKQAAAKTIENAAKVTRWQGDEVESPILGSWRKGERRVSKTIEEAVLEEGGP